MVKKISAIVLALLVCLSAMVVPASALESGTSLGLVLRVDKNLSEIVPGAEVTVYFHFDLADYEQLMSDMRLCLVYDKSVYTPDVTTRTFLNDMADYAKDATVARANDTFGQTCLTAAGASAEEKALYDGGVMIQIGADTTLGANSKRGFLMTEGEDGVSVAQLSLTFTVNDDADLVNGSKNIIWPATIASANQYIKYTDGSNTPKQYATENADFSKNNIFANLPECAENAHTWDDGKVTTEPTCSAEGVKTLTCTACLSTKEVAVDKLGHTPAEAAVKENEVAATCSTAGSYDSVVKCSVCDEEISRTTVTVEATGSHVYSKVIDEKAPTCTEAGYVVKACGCSDDETERTELPATGHTLTSVEAKAPTCTEAGYEAYEFCSACDYTTYKEVAATGHDYDAVVTAPTCTEAGYTTYTCACGDTYKTDGDAATGHTYTAEETTAPTCTATGVMTYTCVCGDTYTEDIAATGHSYDDGKVTKDPSCFRTGTMTYTCTVCEETKEEDIPATNHHYADGTSAGKEIPAKEPTCLSQGNTAGVQCEICNSYIVSINSIPALGHNKDTVVEVVEPTYEEQGYTLYKCSTCGENHKADWVAKKQPCITGFKIAEPTERALRARDTIVLHPEYVGELEEDARIEWTADNKKFKLVENEDGTVTIEAKRNGTSVITATVYDADGVEIATHYVEMTSNAKFFQRIGGFFRVLFKKTIHYER